MPHAPNAGKPCKIYDCFTYDGEECIDLRFKLHADSVDCFVIVESNQTFTGLAKEYTFDAKKYSRYQEKIRYIQLDSSAFTGCTIAWERERIQRNALAKGLYDLEPDDVVLISDVDEMFLPEKIGPVAPGTWQKFQQYFFYFYCDYICISKPLWSKAIAVRGELAKKHNAEDLRSLKKEIFQNLQEITVEKSGWHFSYLGGIDAVISKMSRISHQDCNNDKYKDRERLKNRIALGRDIYGRPLKWGKVSGFDLGNETVRDWFRSRPIMNTPPEIKTYGTIDKVAHDFGLRNRIDKLIGRALWKMFIKLRRDN